MAYDTRQRRGTSVSTPDVVYGLGLIGALVWFWQQNEGFWPHVLGVLEAFVWPAFLIYEAFQRLA